MNASNKTVEQLKAELTAAQEAVAAVERAEREAKEEIARKEWEAKCEAEKLAETTRRKVVLDRVIEELRTTNPEASYESGRILGVWVAIDERRSHTSSWSSKPTGTYSVVVGDYGDKKTFPPTKDGHSYAKVAAEILSRVAAEIAAKKLAEEKLTKKKGATILAQELSRTLGLAESEYSSYEPRISGRKTVTYPIGGGRQEHKEYVPAEGKVYLRVGILELTPEQVLKLVPVLAEMGIVKLA